MTNKITFSAQSEHLFEVAPRPFPAAQALPEWWRSMTPYDVDYDNPEGKKLIIRNHNSNATFKKCTPMLDALTSGYIIPLWSDVLVRQVNGLPEITWRVSYPVFEAHGSSSRFVEAPAGYNNSVFKYINPWIPRTPKGYSVLFTQPFGYKDSPFHAIPAVLDSDSPSIEIIPPVWVKKDFEGVVEKGTPMLQVIPFKRENWQSEFDFYTKEKLEVERDKNFAATIVNNYVKNHWSKKTYK
jgi:hypothetical protein